MELRNVTEFSEFLLLGLSEKTECQPLIFWLFLSMYLITVLGNLLIILAVSSDSHLHTPMYFFLSNLSLVDICFTSTTIPKMLWNIQKQNKAITYAGCITQMYFYIIFMEMDNSLLTVMAYDRYVAICHPLHYMVIMNPRLCGLLVLIVSSICGIPSAQGKYKAFSTCISHLSVVSLFYGTSLGVYLCSAPTQSTHSSAAASVMYTVATPMLNPFIYSLRNKDIKRALKIFLGRAVIMGNNKPYFKRMLQGINKIALVCITNHPGKDLDLHRETFLSEFPCSHFHHMELRNVTGFSEFLLLGLSEEPELQPLIFGLFLSMYLITVLGNLLIILAVSSDSHLHTPMYFFLSNLSLVDICFTSTAIPKMLWNIQKQNRAITYEGCITQMNFFLLFAGLDNFLLTVMAYDPFVAICHPLHYIVIIDLRLCGLLVLGSWIMNVLHSLLQCLVVLRLTFCPDLEISHFLCEIKQMVQLACSDTFLNNMVMYFVAVLLGGGPLVGILYPYSKIVSSICGIPSAQGKYKAFSTCVSHLSVVSLFYGTSLEVYLSSAVTESSSATASVMYTVLTPMLNPFIYSLRNKDIKRALKRLVVIVAIKYPLL
ncbi:hypothetical protein QTO34_015362 [Cnephaeus nilssonii]|uniref:G-protein coupled receptors family 1 profile domain-containing protein n=1 Tax=Cnephaeus nilssonii TaxID=3371016 RepID=A0AA40I433_CNENI|nr:hypothetical protein QTO34_015362 [Eptesicus nilssonii]